MFGGLPVHVVNIEKALQEANQLGKKLGKAVLKGRQPVDEQAHWFDYAGEVWNVYPQYIDNLTEGTQDYNCSLPEQALRHNLFQNPEALKLLQKAAEGLKEVIRFHKLGNHLEAQTK